MDDIELKTLERKIFLQYFEDGFWDIFIGLLLLLFGFTTLFDLGSFIGIFDSLCIFIPKIGKSKITYPRLGYIKFRNTRKRYMSIILLGVMVFGIVLFLLFAGRQDNSVTDFLRKNMLFVIASIFGGAMAMAAAFLEVKRFFLYAALVFFGIILANWVGSLGINLVVIGCLIIVIGLIVLIQFTRKYPID